MADEDGATDPAESTREHTQQIGMLGMRVFSFSGRPGEGLGTVNKYKRRATEAIEACVGQWGLALGCKLLEQAPRLSKPNHRRELVSLPADARP